MDGSVYVGVGSAEDGGSDVTDKIDEDVADNIFDLATLGSLVICGLSSGSSELGTFGQKHGASAGDQLFGAFVEGEALGDIG